VVWAAGFHAGDFLERGTQFFRGAEAGAGPIFEKTAKKP